MRGRLEVKLEEMRAAASEQARKELERKYAVRYHKVGEMRPPAGRQGGGLQYAGVGRFVVTAGAASR